MRCRRRRRDVAAVAAVALCCCEPHASAEGPAGFELLSGHTLSDSEKCGDSNGKKLGPDDRCGNLNGGLKTGGEHTCKGSASGYAACVTEAAAACAGDPACFSFIVPSVGQPGTNWATYTASVGNAAPNKDWDVYHKSVRRPAHSRWQQSACSHQPTHPTSVRVRQPARPRPNATDGLTHSRDDRALCHAPPARREERRFQTHRMAT
jgi:hypothetical protein